MPHIECNIATRMGSEIALNQKLNTLMTKKTQATIKERRVNVSQQNQTVSLMMYF